MEQAYSRWLTHVTEPELREQLKNMSEQERQEAFCRELAFGTGGLRGILGAGTNRMNVYTVRRATQGLANYLKKQKLPLSAAIAHDSRRCGLRSGSKRRQGLSLPEIGADPGAQLGRALFFMRRRHLHHGKPQPRTV